jgi:hypothetical protein
MVRRSLFVLLRFSVQLWYVKTFLIRQNESEGLFLVDWYVDLTALTSYLFSPQLWKKTTIFTLWLDFATRYNAGNISWTRTAPFRTAEFIPVILVEQKLLPFCTAEFIPVILVEQELLPLRTAEFIPVILVEQELLPFRTAEFIPVILVEQELLPFRTAEFIPVF